MNSISIVVVGTALALIGYLVYSVKTALEKEKAALAFAKTASDKRTEMLNQEYLKMEADKRAQEQKDVEAFDDDMERTTVRFYPRVSGKDPNDLN